ncbi:hypothetical protein RRG08_007539 [Elysia crispata]|uniref:Secreted protein n=1 Tax=Elysia crispata TaxID=231223 RepID=A0AAE0YFM4_9GAST|nr:hypothetical protein RRG08_007539 [Elysia crispata]
MNSGRAVTPSWWVIYWRGYNSLLLLFVVHSMAVRGDQETDGQCPLPYKGCRAELIILGRLQRLVAGGKQACQDDEEFTGTYYYVVKPARRLNALRSAGRPRLVWRDQLDSADR